jgi:predicted RND superfamily exporter protein
VSETRQFNELRKWLASEMQDAAQMSGQVNRSDHTRMRFSTRAVAYNRVMQKMDEIEAKFAKAEVESMPSIRDMWVAENGIE